MTFNTLRRVGATSSAHGTKGTFVVYQKSIPARHRRQYPGAHSAVPPSLGDNARSHRPPPGKPTPILALGIIRGEGAWVSYLLEPLRQTFLTDLYEKGQKFRTHPNYIEDIIFLCNYSCGHRNHYENISC